MLLVPLVGIAQTLINPEGSYRSKPPGKAGETNRMSVWSLDHGRYRVGIHTVYCPYKFSPDCANARFGDIEFNAVLKYRRLVYHDTTKKCFVEVEFKVDFADVRQAGDCSGLPYGEAGGRYFKESSVPQELRP